MFEAGPRGGKQDSRRLSSAFAMRLDLTQNARFEAVSNWSPLQARLG
jgi:hypothetical protein